MYLVIHFKNTEASLNNKRIRISPCFLTEQRSTIKTHFNRNYWTKSINCMKISEGYHHLLQQLLLNIKYNNTLPNSQTQNILNKHLGGTMSPRVLLRPHQHIFILRWDGVNWWDGGTDGADRGGEVSGKLLWVSQVVSSQSVLVPH